MATMRTDVPVPEVYAPMISASIEEHSVMLGVCDIDSTLEGQAGDSLTISKWSLGSKAVKLTEGEAIPYDKLTHTTQKIDLFQLAKGYEITDRALLSSIGDPIGEMSDQIGMLIADALDDEAIAIANTTPLTFECAGATAITEDEIDEALNLYGDKQNYNDFECILINPKLKKSFKAMESFSKTTSTTAKKDNGIVKRNIIGEYCGIPVVMSSKGTYDSVNQKCKTFIIKKHSLSVPYKRKLNPEQERNIDKKSYKVNADLIAGVGLVNDAGIVIIEKATA
ncbi:phage major capsid protein [Clostridium brassicae]|uniref:N4-gp56 family major capsid protein n=1 Tax=Clostridium brassicae TaxID=2999072 RepID=A0ABT4D7N2_9CLOT|nr:hypothetical protein [Clostridium brassicae]MCY6958288.1 hypothetical protein [Clostridium brassicae]